MKRNNYKIFYFLLLILVVSSCDKSYFCSFDILCLNSNIKIKIENETYDSYNFSSNDFNSQPLEKYSFIDFYNIDNNNHNAKVYKFELNSLITNTYTISLNIKDANTYVLDFLRVGLLVDGELKVYKYYDKYEKIYIEEDDPDSILHFNSKDEIFSNLELKLYENESKEIDIFVWIEEAELYDENKERYKGWSDKSYNATPIMLSMEIK